MMLRAQEADIRENDAHKKERPARGGSPNRMFGSSGCALGFFGLDVANDSIQHGHLSLLDRCVGIIDGQRSVFVQELGMILERF